MREQYQKQVALLLDVLPIVAKRSVFALKGGTAINFFLHDMPRLSVDIDLHYLPLNTWDEAQQDIRSNIEAIKDDIMDALPGAKAQIDNNSNAQIAYKGTQIKIEPNPKIRGVLLPVVEMKLCQTMSNQYQRQVKVKCVAPEELYAGKLCAALGRQHPRDLFDILLLKSTIGFSRDIIDAFLVYLVSQKKPVHEHLNPRPMDISQLYQKHFQGMTEPEIALEELITVQSQLPGEIMALLNSRDREFLLGFKRGSPDWSLLRLSQAQELPAVRRKLDNMERVEKSKREMLVENLNQVFKATPISQDKEKMRMPELSKDLNPQTQLAHEITGELVKKGLIDDKRAAKLQKQIEEGRLKAEDWSMMLEVNMPKDEKKEGKGD